MAYGTLGADIVQSSTTGTPTQFQDGSGTQIGTLCRAWVSYNGSTPAIIGSFNVSSVTYTSAGTYVANFTTALPDAKYAVAGSQASVVGGVCTGNDAFSTTQFGWRIYNSSFSTANQPYTAIAVFR